VAWDRAPLHNFDAECRIQVAAVAGTLEAHLTGKIALCVIKYHSQAPTYDTLGTHDSYR
jgi:aminoglycoside phosphotransferase family enzyme